MRRWILYTLLLVSSAVLVVSCSTPADSVEFREHPDGWVDGNSDNFHGLFVLDSAGKTSNCTTCHGSDLMGDADNAVPSCFECHQSYPHPDGFADPTTGGVHTQAIADENWDLATCRTCHGSDYAGKNFEAKSCLTCHIQENGPEACNTCHGDDVNIAPPEDLSGSVETTSPGVGAHQVHLMASDITDALSFTCETCHATVSSFDDTDHITGDGKAAIVFSSFATSDGMLSTTYDPGTGTCSNVYCHGDFEFLKSESTRPFVYGGDAITGENPTMVWTDVGTGAAACGTCHGLPPTGHNNLPACSNCHGGVVDADNNIIDTSKHINGVINVFGE